MVFRKYLRSRALDENSLSIGRVKGTLSDNRLKASGILLEIKFPVSRILAVRMKVPGEGADLMCCSF